MKRAFITGISEQDGSYLAEYLLEQEYEVHGLARNPDCVSASDIAYLAENPKINNKRIFFHYSDSESIASLTGIIVKLQPDEFYHLSDGAFPEVQLERVERAGESAGMATLRLLDIVRRIPNPPRFLYASGWEVFGSFYSPQDELTPLVPMTPFGAMKAFSQQLTRIYRETFQLYACSAITYNHESPRRAKTFLSRKVCEAVARIKKGLQIDLCLGNLSGQRDWGWAPDYARGMAQMLKMDSADDFIFATGRQRSVEEFVSTAFSSEKLNWRDYVKFDAKLLRTVEPLGAWGNPAKARKELNWENTVSFEEMIHRMVKAEFDRIS